jgi:hypothetical protein
MMRHAHRAGRLMRQLQVEMEAFHLMNPDELPEDHTLKLDKTLTWAAVMARIAALTGVPAEEQLYWVFGTRDYSQRPVLPFFPQVRPPLCAAAFPFLSRTRTTVHHPADLHPYTPHCAQPQPLALPHLPTPDRRSPCRSTRTRQSSSRTAT